MLRSELPFAADRPARRALAVLLGEAFLGFLAILAVGLTLFPMLFPLRPQAAEAIDAAQWAIIGWFAFEFVFAFAAAENKAQFLTNPWRWLDLATVLIALASLLPSASAALRSSPILRLARIGRLVSLGVRASGLSTRRRSQSVAEPKARGPAQVTLMADAPNAAPHPAGFAELMAWLRSPDEQWFHVSNPSAAELKEIGAAQGLPADFFETHLSGTNYPHWATAGERVGVFLWMPELDEHGHADRHGMLFLPIGKGLLSLSRRRVHAIERTGAQDGDDDLPFAARMMAHVLDRVVRGNEHLAGHCEEQLRQLEDVPVHESRPQFFERTFRLKKELSAAQADLWRLKGIAGELVSGRRLFPAGPHPRAETYQRFANDVEYLYDTTVNIREEVLSVIDLHLNVVSFEMNRVMRVLAVVSVLGLIPAVVGGLFGMNLSDNPWPFTLLQVAFVVFFGMVLGLYFFFVKGWLR
jgi:Mg2+ and Co2+ transporter CorA